MLVVIAPLILIGSIYIHVAIVAADLPLVVVPQAVVAHQLRLLGTTSRCQK